MLIIRPAEKNEFEKVRLFYHSLIDAMENAQYKPGWEKNVYPTNEYLQDSINKKELFVGTIEDKIVSAMIVNHECNESYDKAKWMTDAKPEEIMVIHALGVHPDFSGRGIAKELVANAVSFAKESYQKVIRLDVLGGNVPAEKLYISMGFKYVDTIEMYYEDTGWTDFKLYEYPLKDKTLRLLFPQWQGGVKPNYYFGSRLLAHIVPPSKTDKVVEVPVCTDFDKSVVSMDGVEGGLEILQQMNNASRILEEEQPDKVIVLGGDCSVSQRPFDYLHKKYGDSLGILWLDAHPDVSGTHETSHLHETVLGNLMGQFPDSEITKVDCPFSSEKVMFVGLIEDELRPIDMLVKVLNMKIAVPADIMNDSQVITDWIKEKEIKYLAVHWDFDVLSRADYRSNTCARPHMTKEEYDAAMGELSLLQVGRILKDVSDYAEIVGLALAEHMPWDAINLRNTLAELSIFQ